jgi:hypothetical protein
MSLILDGTAGVNSSGPVVAADGTVSLPGIAFGSDLDNGAYRIGTNNWALAAAGAKVIELTAAGEVLMPLQPAFLAYNSVTDSNVTGAGAGATVDFDTEVFDQGGDFAADTFTAPVTGRYRFSYGVYLDELVAANGMYLGLITSNRTFYAPLFSGSFTSGQVLNNSILCDLDAGDTASVQAVVSDMAGNTVDILGSSTAGYTWFSGELVC